MGAVLEVLRRHGFDVSERAVAERLDALLVPARTGASLSEDDERHLADFAGVRAATAAQLAALDARSAARSAAEAARTLTRAQVASLLGIDGSRVSHQVSQGRLFAYPVGHRPVFPDWQFLDENEAADRHRFVLPNLPVVIAALPNDAHPITVRSFVTLPDDELTVDGRALSPRNWLISGGDPRVVADLAATLGEQV